jgi:hypothetical protein
MPVHEILIVYLFDAYNLETPAQGLVIYNAI